jgi:hypothetical protein
VEPLSSNVSTYHTATSLRLFIPKGLQAYCYFFSEGCTCNICARPSFPFPWFDSRSDYSPTVPSLRSLVWIGYLIRCELVQVYHHHPWSRFPLNPIYRVIYPGDYLVWALPWGLRFGRLPLHAGWAIEPHFVALLAAHRVGQAVTPSFQAVTGQPQMLAGITVDVV